MAKLKPVFTNPKAQESNKEPAPKKQFHIPAAEVSSPEPQDTNFQFPTLKQYTGEEQTPTPETKGASIPTERFYVGSKEIDSDLFKLEVSYMLKDMGWKDDPKDIVRVEHVHFFRTFDSAGKKQTECQTIGGHFHAIQEIQNADGSITIKAGPAKKWVMKGKGPNAKRVMQDLHRDHHTHEITYVLSHKVQSRKANEEFAKFAATQVAPAPVAGVFEE